MADFNISQLKAVTFDVFGTVVDWRTGVAREAQAILGKQHGLSLDWNAFAVHWRSLYDPAMKKIRDSNRDFVILDQLHRENLDEVLREFEILSLDEQTMKDLNEAWHRLPPWPDVVAGLNRLKTRYLLATLSNGNIALMANLARHSDLPWHAIVGGEIARAYKPSPEAYTRSAAALGLEPGQCMLVAAHNVDLEAAREQGFCTGFVPRPNEHGSGQSKDLQAESDWDIVADDFEDLAARLAT